MFKDKNKEILINTVFLGLCWVFTLLNLFFQSIKNVSVPSVLLKINIILIFLWFAYSIACIIINKKIFTDKTKFVALCSISLIFVISLLNIIIVKKFQFSFTFFNKFLVTSNTLIFLYLVVFQRVDTNYLRWFIIVSWVFGIFLFLSYVTGYGREWRGMVSFGSLTLNFYNPNFAAVVLYFIICYLIVGIFIFKNIVFRASFILVILTSSFLLLQTGSRNPIIAIFFGFIIVAFLKFIKTNRSRYIYSFFVSYIPLLFACLYIILIYILNSKEISIISLNGKDINTRFDVWTNSFKAFLKHPIFGSYSLLNNGVGLFQLHNSHVDFLVAYGLIPFCLLLNFLTIIINKCFLMKFHRSSILTVVVISSILFGISEASFLYSGSTAYIIAFTPFALLFSKTQDNLFETHNAIYECDNLHQFRNFKVLQINSVCKIGSTGSLVYDHHKYLCKDGVDSYVIYGRGAKVYESNILKIGNELYSKIVHFLCDLIKNPNGFGYLNTIRIIETIKVLKPNVVHLHNLNDYYINEKMLLEFLNKKGIKVVYTLHSEMAYLANCGGNAYDCCKWKEKPGCLNCPIEKNAFYARKYFIKKERYYGRLNKNLFTFTAVSPWLAKRAKESIILSRFKILEVQNGVDISVFPEAQHNAKNQNKKIGFITASFDNPNKGGKWIPLLANSFPSSKDIEFLIVSLTKPSSLFENQNIKYCGSLTNKTDLYKFISDCDLTLSLSKSETFGMPVIESLCCGTPVAGFDSGGPSSISDSRFAKFVKFGDIDQLHNIVEELLHSNLDKSEIQKYSLKRYDILNMTKKFEDIYLLSNNSSYSQNNLRFEKMYEVNI